MSKLLPLFPLQLVALPGVEVPLHIFEERYKTMVGEAERNDSEFGIVLAKDGGIVDAGCTVRVETVLQRYPDGRFDVITRGQRRFRIGSLDKELEYLRGEVEFFADDEWTMVGPELRNKAIDAFEFLRHTLHQLGEPAQLPDPIPEHPHLSFLLAQSVDDLDFQSLMLRNRSEADRLQQYIAFMPKYLAKRMYVAKLKKAAPTNGHGHKPGGAL